MAPSNNSEETQTGATAEPVQNTSSDEITDGRPVRLFSLALPLGHWANRFALCFRAFPCPAF